MDDRHVPRPGEEEQARDWSALMRSTAASFPYPPTPDIAAATTRRLVATGRAARRGPVRERILRPRWAVTIVVLAVIASLLGVPQVRAAVIEALRIGAVRIFRAAPGAGTTAPTGQPAATVISLSSVLDLAGETTLKDARTRVSFPLRLPEYPPTVGAPDAVFVQDVQAPVVIMAWKDESSPTKVGLSLFQMEAGAYFAKIEPKVIEETEVNGQAAIWAEGPYMLQSRSGDVEYRRLVQGNALIWTAGPTTYRLETGLGVEEARRIAESLR